jgi:hypothetical protein
MIKTKTTRSHRSRLAELELIAQEVLEQSDCGPISYRECMDHYRHMADLGLYQNEPDFETVMQQREEVLSAYPQDYDVPPDNYQQIGHSSDGRSRGITSIRSGNCNPSMRSCRQ